MLRLNICVCVFLESWLFLVDVIRFDDNILG